MSEKTTRSSGKRSSSDEPAVESATSKAVEQFGGEPVTTHDEALEAGYFGGPADDTDHTLSGELERAEQDEKEAGG
jgi:hypothetical protein